MIDKTHIQSIDAGLPFWTEAYKSTLIKVAELQYNDIVLKTHSISDIVINGDKVLYR